MVGGRAGSGTSDLGPNTYLPRTPGTGVRILLFLLSVSGSAVLLMLGFPPGVPDRLPVLAIALVLAILSAQRPERGILLFSFLFPCAGLLVRLFGGTDPTTWPALLFGGLATGWSFRFIYDFESVPNRSRLDRPLAALLLVWVLSVLLALARADTLWALLHGLAGRTVNGEGLLDAEAVRESVFAFSALAAGCAFFFLLRRSGQIIREKALRAALLGVSFSGAAAGLQRLGVLPPETRDYWKMTGRLAGGAADPNSLGLLCGLFLVVTLAGGVRRERRTGLPWLILLVLALGLLLSGSRSGFLLAILALPILLVGRGLPSRVRLAGLAVFLVVAVLLALLALRVSPGTLGQRIAESFDPSVPIEYRVSERPILWRSAWRLFLRHPLEGAGMGVFSWQFPDLMREEGRRFALRDNPGSAYVQALAETGVLGFLLTGSFVLSLGAQALSRARGRDREPLAAGAGVALAAFIPALAVGSHWLAPDVALLFFLLAAFVSLPQDRPDWPWSKRTRVGAVLLYAVAALASVLSTARPEETFRYSPRIGFHDREVGTGGPFRWTRRNFAVWVRPGETQRLGLAHFAPSSKPIGLTVTLDGRTAFQRSLAPGEGIALRLSGSSYRPEAFLFRLSSVFVPRRFGPSEDRRELGLLSVSQQ